MPRIEYRVVQDQTAVPFMAAVHAAFVEGWELYGDMCTHVWAYDSGTGGRVVEWWYRQTMIRPVVDPIPELEQGGGGGAATR